jgi:hypothetical protein
MFWGRTAVRPGGIEGQPMMSATMGASYRMPEDEFARLMEAGRLAYAQGNRQRAHDLWREAATIDPYSEQVWLALLDVLDTDEDRIVCLQNVIAINPMNIQARRQLRAYGARTQELKSVRSIPSKTARRTATAAPRKRSGEGMLRRAVLLGILFGLSGVLFAIVLSILLYAR